MLDHYGLLDIKQAAALLQVSETSLRRWTNSGLLPCFRVGGRRERRFRRADLLAFVAGPDLGNRVDPDPSLPARDHREGGDELPFGHQSHRCAFYSSGDERVSQAADFLAEGLRLGNACFLAATTDVRFRIRDRLADHRRSLQTDIDAGRLVFSEYATSAVAQVAYWETMFVRATRSGARALRVVGDVTSARFTSAPTIEDAIAYEADYERSFVRRFPLTTLCQYDVRGLAGRDVLRLIECHDHRWASRSRAASFVD
jgi:transcriptional repressor of dcmA and dcmR